MKILALSEHFFPRLGGTVNYVHKTCQAIKSAGHEVELLVPKQTGEDRWPEIEYQVTQVEAGYPALGDPSRRQRREFARSCARIAKERAKLGTIDAVHVQFGLYVMAALPTQQIAKKGIPCIATIHNLPPNECRRAWADSSFREKLFDRLRTLGVSIINHRRARKQAFDAYVVPSEQVRQILERVLPKREVFVIHHGLTKAPLGARSAHVRASKQLRVLTVGGWAPHKRQDWIPEIADRLRDARLDFRWDVVGPDSRFPGFKESIEENLASQGLQDHVHCDGPVPGPELEQLYAEADVYVQPSREEGFCLTALDGAAQGIPVVATEAGALAEIARLSGVQVCSARPSDLAETVMACVSAPRPWAQRHVASRRVVRHFSWSRAAQQLIEVIGKCRRTTVRDGRSEG